MFCWQILGVLLISGGALALMGSSRRDKNVLTASLLLSLLGILLAFEFAVEVSQQDRHDLFAAVSTIDHKPTRL